MDVRSRVNLLKYREAILENAHTFLEKCEGVHSLCRSPLRKPRGTQEPAWSTAVQDMSSELSRDGRPEKKTPGRLEPERRWTCPSSPCTVDAALHIYIVLFLLEKQRAHLPDHIPPPGNRNESGCCLSLPVFIASSSFYAELFLCYHTLKKSMCTLSFDFGTQNHPLHFPKPGSS